jgi:subtilisin
VAHVYRYALKGYSAQLDEAALPELRRDRRVRWVERDKMFRPTTQALPAGIDRVDADWSGTAGIDGVDRRVDVDVAIFDGGVSSHPDLNVAGGMDCAGQGTPLADPDGHGTHIGGIIGALDNGEGVVGIAPGARLWSVRVLNAAGNSTTKSLVCGIDFLTARRTDNDPANDIEVANISMGGPGRDDGNCGRTRRDAVHLAICASVAAGVTYVVAAGNESTDAARSVPASYDEVLTVSAIVDTDGVPGGTGPAPCAPDQADRDDTFASFSNFGPDIDFAAPGVCVLSTVPLTGARYGNASGYGVMGGTSFAAPHVAGAAALYLARHPGASPAEVRSALGGAGRLDWDAGDDPDGIQEPLISVAGF